MRVTKLLPRLPLLLVPILTAGIGLAAPAGATYPGPEGKIAFNDRGTGQIYSINPDGTGLRRLTDVPDDDFAVQPDWSPDGRHIAFSIMSADGNQLFVMNADGSGRRPVFPPSPGSDDLDAQYTPDGQRFVFRRCEGEACALFSVRTDGSQLRALTPFQPEFEVADVDPAISPDGARVAFTRIGAGGVVSQVYVMRADGSGAHPITPPALEGFAPDWTPDGRQLLVSSNLGRLNSAIFRVRPDGGGLERLTRPAYPHNDIRSSSSPRGDRMIFTSDRTFPDLCCRQLYIARQDGRGLRRLPIDLLVPTAPDWGPAPPDAASAPSTRSTADTAPAAAPAPSGPGPAGLDKMDGAVPVDRS